jgi:hypothetical protein
MMDFPPDASGGNPLFPGFQQYSSPDEMLFISTFQLAPDLPMVISSSDCADNVFWPFDRVTFKEEAYYDAYTGELKFWSLRATINVLNNRTTNAIVEASALFARAPGLPVCQFYANDYFDIDDATDKLDKVREWIAHNVDKQTPFLTATNHYPESSRAKI